MRCHRWGRAPTGWEGAGWEAAAEGVVMAGEGATGGGRGGLAGGLVGGSQWVPGGWGEI